MSLMENHAAIRDVRIGVAVPHMQASSVAEARRTPTYSIACLSPNSLDSDRHRRQRLSKEDLALHLGAVRNRRVVQEDAHLAVVAALVAKAVLDGGDVAGGGAREVVRAHGNADAVDNLHLVVVVDDLGPALAAVDREAGVLVVAVVDDGA